MRFAQAALQLSDPLAVLFVRPHRSVSPPQRGYRRLFDVFLPAVEQRSCDVVVAAGLSDVAVLQTLDHDGELLFRTSLDLRFSWHLASWKPFASWASPIGARRTITPQATAASNAFPARPRRKKSGFPNPSRSRKPPIPSLAGSPSPTTSGLIKPSTTGRLPPLG